MRRFESELLSHLHAKHQALLDTIRGLRARGVAILYVSHKLEEVFAIADVVTVLRDGRNAAPTAPLSTSHTASAA